MNIVKTMLLGAIITLSNNFCALAQKKEGNDFTLKIDLSNMQPAPDKLQITYFQNESDGRKSYGDSTFVENNKVIFKGKVNEPCFAMLRTDTSGDNVGTFILSGGELNIKMGKTINDLSVEGSKYQEDYQKLTQKKDVFENKIMVLEQAYHKSSDPKDEVKKTEYLKQFNQITAQAANEVWKDYVIKNAKKSALSLYALWMYDQSGHSNPKEIKSLYNMLSAEFKILPTAESIKVKYSL